MYAWAHSDTILTTIYLWSLILQQITLSHSGDTRAAIPSLYLILILAGSIPMTLSMMMRIEPHKCGSWSWTSMILAKLSKWGWAKLNNSEDIYSCLYFTVHLPGTSLAKVEVSLTLLWKFGTHRTTHTDSKLTCKPQCSFSCPCQL
jgi:hypothetical protein